MRRHKALVSVCSATLTAAVQVLYEIRQIEGILLFCQKQRSIILPVDDPVDNPDILAVRNHHISSACGCDGGSSQLGRHAAGSNAAAGDGFVASVPITLVFFVEFVCLVVSAAAVR